MVLSHSTENNNTMIEAKQIQRAYSNGESITNDEALLLMLDVLEMIQDEKLNLWSDKRHRLDCALSAGRLAKNEIINRP